MNDLIYYLKGIFEIARPENFTEEKIAQIRERIDAEVRRIEIKPEVAKPIFPSNWGGIHEEYSQTRSQAFWVARAPSNSSKLP